MKARKTAAVLGVLLFAGVAVACGSDDKGDGGAGGNVCPEKLKIQTDWFPEADHGWTYQMIGPDGKQDPQKGSYTGQYCVSDETFFNELKPGDLVVLASVGAGFTVGSILLRWGPKA